MLSRETAIGGLVICILTMVMIGAVLYPDPVGEPHHGEPHGGEPPCGQPQGVVNSSPVDHRYVIFDGETAWLVH
jgi:hypothetical protein